MTFFDILKIIILGIVEGITEWLPVSSTGHLILLDRFWDFENTTVATTDFMNMFEYVIQLAAIIAVVVIFWKKIFPINVEINSLSVQTKSGEKTQKKLQLSWNKDILIMWLKLKILFSPLTRGAVI